VHDVQTVVVLAAATDTVEPTDTPAPTDTPEPSLTPPRTPTRTSTPTETARPTMTPWPSPTAVALNLSERRDEWVLHHGNQWLPYDAPIGPPYVPDPRSELLHDLALPMVGGVAARRLRIDGQWRDVVGETWLA
jgi:hypothetical protein